MDVGSIFPSPWSLSCFLDLILYERGMLTTLLASSLALQLCLLRSPSSNDPLLPSWMHLSPVLGAFRPASPAPPVSQLRIHLSHLIQVSTWLTWHHPPTHTPRKSVYKLTLSAHSGSFSSLCPSWPLSVKGACAFQVSLLRSDFSFALVFFFEVALLSMLPFLPPPPGCQPSVLLPTGCLDCCSSPCLSLLCLLLPATSRLSCLLSPLIVRPPLSSCWNLLWSLFSLPFQPCCSSTQHSNPSCADHKGSSLRCLRTLPFPFPIILPSALPFT